MNCVYIYIFTVLTHVSVALISLKAVHSFRDLTFLYSSCRAPKDQNDYENNLAMEVFLFQFVNYYSSCFYITFFKGRFVTYPGDLVYWL